MRALAVLLVAGCGAELGGNGSTDASENPDAKVFRDAGIDAPRACAGGTAAMTAPDGSCLVFVNSVVTRAAAKLACMNMNAHLAYLKTAAVDTAAEALVGSVDTWIGASDLVTEGTFVWDDGSALGFANWHTGVGLAGGSGATYQEDCVIVAGARVGKQWDDRPCDASEVASSGMFAYLCQY